MINVVSWNIATMHQPWRDLVEMGADIALLQEVGTVPDDVASRVELSPYPESTEAMGRGVDTRDDGQGKANGASPIPIDGDEGGVR